MMNMNQFKSKVGGVYIHTHTHTHGKASFRFIVVMLILSLPMFVKSQTLNFTFSSDTVYAGDTVFIENTSLNIPDSALYVFKYNIVNEGHALISDTVFNKNYLVGKKGIFIITLNSGIHPVSLQLVDTTITNQVLEKSFFVQPKSMSCNSSNSNCNAIRNPYIDAPYSGMQTNGAGCLGWAYCWDNATLVGNQYNHYRMADLFNTCQHYTIHDSLFKIPFNNFSGWQHQIGLTSMTGFVAYIQNDIQQSIPYSNDTLRNFREYPSTMILNPPLIAGQLYEAGMYVNLADKSKIAVRNIGMYFGPSAQQGYRTEIGYYPIPQTIQKTPQIVSDSIISDTLGWKLISGTFISTGGNCLHIGNFSKDDSTDLVVLEGSQTILGDYVSYYYVDGVYLRPIHQNTIDTIICCKNNSISISSKLHVLLRNTFVWNTGATTLSINVNPIVPTLYTVTSTDVYGCTKIDSYYLIPSDMPAKPIIAGNFNNCDTTNFYTITNSQAGTTYNWTATNTSSISQNNTTCSVMWNYVNFPQPPNYATVKIIANNGCSDTTIFKVWNCCQKGGNALLNGDTITTALISGYTYNVNGAIVFAESVTNNNNILIFGPEAKIIINPNKTVIFNNSTLKAECGYMWDGIYPLSGGQITINGSTVSDALNAIVSDFGAMFSVYNSTFNKNLYGILVKNYSSTHPGVISKCTFNCIDPYSGTPVNLINPYSNRRGIAGVKVSDVNNIQIGVTTSINDKNYFKNLDYGVHIQGSNATLYNNSFGPLPKTSGLILPDNGFGIYAERSSLNGNTINVGNASTSTVYRNSFDTCGVGIRTQNSFNLNIQRNSFRNNYSGTFITDNTYSNINILNNVASNQTFAGFWLNNFANSNVVINSDSIINSYFGIYLSNNVTTHTSGLQVKYNTVIGNMYTGIVVTNVEGTPQSNSATWTKIANNNINFSGISLTSTLIRSGIRIESSARTIVEQCSVTYNASIPDTIQAQRLAGVYMTLSDSTYLCSNTFINMGMGVRVEGYCNKSKFVLNKFDKINSTEGFGFKCYNGTVGSQGTYSQAFDNSFYGFTLNLRRGHGTMDARYGWFYRNLIQYRFDLSSDQNISSTAPISIGSTTTCGYPTSGGFLMSVSENENNSDQSNAVYVNNIEENRYIDKYVEYRNFTQDVAITSLIDEYKNIPLFSKINKAINQKDYVQASLFNNSIQPMNTYEKNLKTVNEIYLRTWALGNYNLSLADYTTLIDIAMQAPMKGGYGVINAWVMTQRFDILQDSEKKFSNTRIPIVSNYKIYPNPANSSVTLSGINGVSQILIYNILGKLEFSLTNNSENVLKIDVSKFAKGVYVIKLLDSESKLCSVEKLVVE